jgi:cobalt-zinc-cadmium efflux system outer membrane protein
MRRPVIAWRAYLFVGLSLAVAAGVTASEPENAAATPATAPQTGVAPLALADLELLALQHNPTVAQAAAAIDVSRGKALQAGLYPNPTVGYAGDQIGIAGTAGELQGAFVQQTIVTAGKLRLSRAKYNQEAYEAEIRALGQQHRVLNGVRLRFFELLALQQTIGLNRSLLENAEESLRTTREMANTGQANRADVLLAEAQVGDARVALRTVENRYPALWQQLAALVGTPDLLQAPLNGRLEPEGPPLDRECALQRLLGESPELQAARAHVVYDQITLRREQVEPVPDVQLQAAAGYNFETRNAVASGVQVGIKLPLWNRNQGTIREVQADLARARAEVTRVELSLRERLADAFDRYQTARETAQVYRETILPRTREAYEVQQEMYKQRRTPWPEVVRLRRAKLDAEARHTRALLELRQAEVEITGLLQVDGLSVAPAPPPGGHLEATPDPR